jgi:hypothetical protein
MLQQHLAEILHYQGLIKIAPKNLEADNPWESDPIDWYYMAN